MERFSRIRAVASVDVVVDVDVILRVSLAARPVHVRYSCTVRAAGAAAAASVEL